MCVKKKNHFVASCTGDVEVTGDSSGSKCNIYHVYHTTRKVSS